MNTTTRIAAIALSFFAAGAALADDPTIEPVVPKTSTVTRAQVQAELAQARASGLLLVNDAVGVPAAPLLSQKTRAEVRAELIEAIANGDLQALNSDNSFDGRVQAKRAAYAAMLMARAAK
jgi:hypothetical protein